MAEPQQNRTPSTPSDGPQRIKVGVIPLFSTWIVRLLRESAASDERRGDFFRDPRDPAVAMYETPEIGLPWVGSGLGIPFAPATGQLLVFPAWVEHRVERFEGSGERISIAFNVSNP